LIVGGRRDVLLDSHVCEKRRDVCAGHRVGMAFLVEEHELCNPGHIGCLRANRLVLEPDSLAHRVKKLLGTVFHDGHFTQLYARTTDCARWGNSCNGERCTKRAMAGGSYHKSTHTFPSAIPPKRLTYKGRIRGIRRNIGGINRLNRGLDGHGPASRGEGAAG
jgi:hypothetical protein